MMFFQIPPTPEQQQQQDRETELWRQDIHEALEGLTLQQIQVLSRLFNSINDPRAAYFAGILSGMAHEKFGTCLMCDKTHVPDPEEFGDVISKESEKVEPTEEEDKPPMSVETYGDWLAEEDVRLFNYQHSEPGPAHIAAISKLNANPIPPDDMDPEARERALALMEQYGLDDAWDEDTKAFLGYICINCRRIYPSIQDRILQPPGVDGCRSCQLKAAHG